MTHRSLDEILTEMGRIQDRLLDTEPDDFEARARLSNLQDALRQEARLAREDLPDDLSAKQLEAEIERREQQLIQYLEARLSPSAGHGGGGGRGGGGIDPQHVHELHRRMDSAFGYEEKRKQLELLKGRLAKLRDE